MGITYNSRQKSLALLLVLFGVGCPADDPQLSPAAAVCERLDECNYLAAGTRAADCVSVTTECLDEQRASERDDWAFQTSDCLNLKSCGNFLRCFSEVGYCAPSPDQDAGPPDAGPPDAGEERFVEGLIQPSILYSAFDGTHEYQVTPSVPAAAEGWNGGDPVDANSLSWTVDTKFVHMAPFEELSGAVKLSSKRSGTTVVKVTATTISGEKVRGEAKLIISTAKQVEWDAGEARYNNGMMIPWNRPEMAAPGEGTCGLPVTIDLPKDSACGNCHNAMSSMITIEFTPTQTAFYSDEELIKIFTSGEKPLGGTFNSPFLRSAPNPDCIYKAFHTWDMTDDERKGIVWKLRSIPPKVQQEIDFGRLAQAARKQN